MPGHSTITNKSQGLTAIQLQAVDLLVSGMPAVGVAEKISVHPSTISVWKRDPQFESTINVLLRQTRNDNREKLRALGHDALETIKNLMTDTSTSAKDRLTAALKVVEMLKIEEHATKSIGKPETNPACDLLNEFPDMHEKMLNKDMENYLKSIAGEVNSLS